MLDYQNITVLRMVRQFLTTKAHEDNYIALYRDVSPGQNVYWNGFGDPPTITFRADFDDMEYNRNRQKARTLIKGRFQGGNLGWIEKGDLELFAALAKKPLVNPTKAQQDLLTIIKTEGPMNIQMMKDITGMLVKEITPILHRLQEAFLIYEDQYDGEWDRAWYMFEEMFPDANLNKYTRHDALKIILQRFAYRNVLINADMAKSFYKLTAKDINLALAALIDEKTLVPYEDKFMLTADFDLLQKENFTTTKSVFAMHRNDFLVKSNEFWLKVKYKNEFDILQYLLIDGEFMGVVVGKFKNGPYIIEDIILNIPNDEKQIRKDEIIKSVYQVNNPEYSPIKKYCGENYFECCSKLITS